MRNFSHESIETIGDPCKALLEESGILSFLLLVAF